MKSKIVTAYWMDCQGSPFQGVNPIRKIRYQGSLISHCLGSNLPVVCYTHQRNFDELNEIKLRFNLTNLELKILELTDIKFHKEINNIRTKNFDTDLDGRGPEIMWGKFDVIERELEGFDRVYWVDVGLQHPGIFPWMYSKVYDSNIEGFGVPRDWWNNLDVFNFSKFIDSDIYTKLDQMCDDKLVFVCSYDPQIGYPFLENGILSQPFESPYPVGGMIGGDVKVLKKYINLFWGYAKQMLEKESLCTEEVLMKPSYDLIPDEEKVTLIFNKFASGEHDDYHYKIWDSEKNPFKPFYMMWHDIKNFKI
tara:strand:+ start:816 stop:1739 length:924 start_codon:yes stop_codon:yes gene_type:complete